MKISDKIRSTLYEKYKKIEISEHNLLYLFLEITKKCNMSCLHCGTDCKSVPDSPELTTESWLKIVDYIVENFSDQIVFVITGGEPLVHPDLIKITEHIKSKNRRWGMVTNGILLTEKKFEELQNAGLYSITVSLDGLETAHNKLRNSPNAFAKALKSLEIIGKSNLKFKDAVTCVFSENLHQLDEIAELLLKNGMNSWRLYRIFLSGRALFNPITQLTFEQTQEMLVWISNNRKKYAERGLDISYSCEGFMDFEIDRKIRKNPYFCRAGVNIASILADGNITGCSNNHTDFHRGNIVTDNFANVWNNNFGDFRERKWLKSTICESCEYIKKCGATSIHLWNLKTDRPGFCYMKDLENV